MKRIVINEMRAWRKRLVALGATARIIGATAATYGEDEWEWVAVAYNPSTKRDVYLLVRKEEAK